MNITVFLKDGDKITIQDADYARHEAGNEHNGSPDMLVVYKNVNNGSWEELKVVAEFHNDSVAGWIDST